MGDSKFKSFKFRTPGVAPKFKRRLDPRSGRYKIQVMFELATPGLRDSRPLPRLHREQ